MAEQLYCKYVTNENGEPEIVAYAYGEDWVAMALYMDDWKYPTEEEAREAWRRYKEHDSTLHSR